MNEIKNHWTQNQRLNYRERKVFQYPFLFDMNLQGEEGETNAIPISSNQTWNCDYIFESLQPLSCNIFRKVFKWSIQEECEKPLCTPVYSHYSTKEFQPNLDFDSCTTVVEYDDITISDDIHIPSIDTVEWHHDTSWNTVLYDEFKRLFAGDFVPVGTMFTTHVLQFGTIGHYYVQYLANGLFGHPNAIMAIHNRITIKTQFSQLSEMMVRHFTQYESFTQFAQQLFQAFTEMAPERWNMEEYSCLSSSSSCSFNEFPFQKGDVLECMIRIKGSIQFPSSSNKQINQMKDAMIRNSSICDEKGALVPQLWKIRFLLV